MIRLVGTYMTLNISTRPSQMIGVYDEYTAFCFDEAFAFVLSKLKAGEEPVFEKKIEKVYSRPSEFYRKFEQRGG